MKTEETMEKKSVALLALGSNMGDSMRNIRDALAMLASLEKVNLIATSSIYRTLPVGGPIGQPDFLNGAALVRTSLTPRDLLARTSRIEQLLRRERHEFWGPRTIDLDLILYDDVILNSPELILPHPRLYWRSFVLDPAVEIAPELVVPTTGLSLRETRDLARFIFASAELFLRLLEPLTDSKSR